PPHCHRGRDRLRARLFDPAAVAFRQPAAGRHHVKRPHPNACARLVPRQPPLYERLLWSVQQLTGPTLPSFLPIKYGLLTGTVAFLYLAATRIFRERGFAILAGLLPLLLFQFAWNLHEGVTHSMVLTCAVAASLWALMRIKENGRASDYLLFGLIVGLGLISKWGFA